MTVTKVRKVTVTKSRGLWQDKEPNPPRTSRFSFLDSIARNSRAPNDPAVGARAWKTCRPHRLRLIARSANEGAACGSGILGRTALAGASGWSVNGQIRGAQKKSGRQSGCRSRHSSRRGSRIRPTLIGSVRPPPWLHDRRACCGCPRSRYRKSALDPYWLPRGMLLVHSFSRSRFSFSKICRVSVKWKFFSSEAIRNFTNTRSSRPGGSMV